MKIGIIVAMDKELRQLESLFKGSDVRVVKCGIGKVNAALGAQRLIDEFHPDAIISSGCAGGHGVGVDIQHVVVAAETAYHDVYCGKAIDGSTVYGQVQGMPARFQADGHLLAVAQEVLERMGHPYHVGLTVTGDWFVDSREKASEIVSHFPEAVAIDMESAAIAHACNINNVSFLSFRIVSDLPLRDSEASQYHDFWDKVADSSFMITKSFIEAL